MSIRDKIRIVRLSKGIKQEELAFHLSMGQSTFSKIENNLLKIRVLDLIKIAYYTQTCITEFIPLSPFAVVPTVQATDDWAIANKTTENNAIYEEKIKDPNELILELKNIVSELRKLVSEKDKKIEKLYRERERPILHRELLSGTI